MIVILEGEEVYLKRYDLTFRYSGALMTIYPRGCIRSSAG